jgi:hypothetical protein
MLRSDLLECFTVASQTMHLGANRNDYSLKWRLMNTEVRWVELPNASLLTSATYMRHL